MTEEWKHPSLLTTVIVRVSACSGYVPVQSIHPRPATPSARDFHAKLGSVSNNERKKTAGIS